MVQNGGPKLTPLYTDENLLERLRAVVTDDMTNKRVKAKAQNMYIGWAQTLKGERGFERLATLHKQLPTRARKARPQPKYLSNDPRDLEDDDEEDTGRGRDDDRRGYRDEDDRRRRYDEEDYHREPSSSRGREPSSSIRREPSSSRGHAPPPIPSSSSKPSFSSSPAPSRTHKKKASTSRSSAPVRVDLAKERPFIQKAIADSSTASTNLINSLALINWERELSTENKTATEGFNRCRQLRKSILKYIHSIESEEFIGSLIHANEELITALKKYDEMSRPQDYDSDSEDSDYEQDDWKVEADKMQQRMEQLQLNTKVRSSSAGPSNPSSPAPVAPRHAPSTYHEVDDDNPFGDSNAI